MNQTYPIGQLGKGWCYWLDWSGHKDPLHLTSSFGIEFFAFFSPLKRARGQLFDQSHLGTFMDEIHAPICQKGRTN